MSYPRVPLSECAKIVSGGTPSTSYGAYWDGPIAWATPADLSQLDNPYIADTPRKITAEGLASCAAEILPPNSVLFSSRAPIGHVAINTVPMATNQGFKSFVPDPRRLDARFLYFWLRANRSFLENLGNGATFKEVSKSVVSRVEVPLPALSEQRRIAAILDQADDLRRKRKHAATRLENTAHSELERLLDENSFPLSALRDVCRKITDGTHQAPKWSEGGIPFIFVSNIRNQTISLDTTKFVSEETYAELTRRSPIEKGDVLYTAVGSYGNAALVVCDEKFLFQRHVAHIKPDPKVIDGCFLSYLLEATELRRQADQTAVGVAQKTVTLDALKKFSVPIPPVEIQVRFSEFVSRIDEVKSAYRAHLARLDALFASLQHRAFRGEL